MTLEIAVETTPDNIPIVRPKGEIDLHTCSGLRDALGSLTNQKHSNIIIDLVDAPYLDSAALGVLVDAVRRVRESDGSIYLVAATPFVRRIFEITRLVKIFHLEDDVPAALATIRSQESAKLPA